MERLVSLFTPSLTEMNRLPIAAPLNATTGRTVKSLDGEWGLKLAPSPAEVGERWWEDKDGWRSLTVPGVWTRQDTGRVRIDDLGQDPSRPGRL